MYDVYYSSLLMAFDDNVASRLLLQDKDYNMNKKIQNIFFKTIYVVLNSTLEPSYYK